MKKLRLSSMALLLIVSISLSCSSDGDEQICFQINVNLTINGEPQTFQAYGRGISIRQNGYELGLNFSRRINDPFSEQSIYIVLPYQKTGENIIEHFYYNQYSDNVSFEGDFVNGEFQSNVLTNTNTCFYATISGKLSDGVQEITITDGEISYEYRDPF